MNTAVSVFIITLNESKHLNQVLTAVSCFDEIIIVDSGSTDDTCDIARRHGAVVIHQPWLGFAQQKNIAMQACSNEWVLNIDGDEILSSENISAIQQVVKTSSPSFYRLHFEDIFWGQPMSPHSSKRSIVRLSQKTKTQYPLDRKVHENIIIPKDENVGDIKGLTLHYGYESTDTLMQKQNRYSTLKAEEKFLAGKHPSLLKLIVIFPLTFIKFYFLRKMLLSGTRGFVQAHIEAMYAFLKEAKLFERHFRNK